ncbi:MAG: dethiobiotin synthase [Bdellovibrionales bacterium]|nr:dethiobiotin synthase [Bdellovibrionales bacterium]
MKALFVTGTGTGVGKTLVSLGLCLHFKADYWKPIQTGQDKDTDFIKKFLKKQIIHPSSYDFKYPLSPNQAAQKENKRIHFHKIKAPRSSFLITEGAGGVFVPLNQKDTLMDFIQWLKYPVIVTAQSGLGTLNHSLLTLEALRRKKIKVLGVILSGPLHQDNKKDIEKWGKTQVILELPFLKTISSQILRKHFKKIKL